jgi:hypothetical protein
MIRVSPRSSANDNGSDLYRIGIGLDFVQILKALRTN